MALVGGGGSVRVRRTEEGESVRGREREQRGRKRGEGTRGVRGRLGNASVEAGGGRGGIGARHRAASVRGEEEDKGEGGGGLGQREELGRLQVSGPGGLQVMFPSLSLFFLFYFCFLFF